MPPTAPPVPPRPVTEPTSRLGNISEARVKIFADHPWCAAREREMRASAHRILGAKAATMPDGMQNAHRAIAVLRARLGGQPRLIKNPESHPPATLPTPEMRNGIQENRPISSNVKPRACLR